MPSVSKKQQRFFGIIRAIKKGVFKGKKTPEIQRAASSISDKDSKKMASTKHKGLPEKVKEELNTDDKPFVKKLVGKLRKGSKTHAKQADDLEKAINEDYVKELEDGLVKMDYPSYDEVDKLMCKIAKENDIDTTTLHMAFKTKHLMVPDDWAKKKMMEPVMIPKTPKITGDVKEELNKDDKPFVKKLVGKLRKGSKTHAKQADDLEKAMVSEKRKINDMEKKLYDRQKPSSDMITARPGEAKKQGELVDKYSKKYKTPTQKNETQKLLKGIARGEVHQESITAKQRFKRDAGAIAKKKIKQKEHNKYVNFLDVDEAVNAAQQAAIAISKRERLQDLKVAKKRKLKKEDYEPVITEKCWKGYEKKGMKTMFGKRYPNCVKKKKTRKEEFEVAEDYYRGQGEKNVERTKKYMKSKGQEGAPGLNAMKARQEDHKARRGVKKTKRDEYGDPVGGPKISKKEKEKNLKKNTPDEQHTTTTSEAVNPAQQAAIAISKREREEKMLVDKKKKSSYQKNDYEPDMSLVEGTPAWQRKAGKSESGGLNAKGVASYRAANPGSKLKTAVTTKPSKLKKGSKAAKRRKSFCKRMKGMKSKLTSAKTARDPDSRINKALRKWNCSFEPENGEVLSETMIATIKRKVKVLGGGSNKKPAPKTTGRDAGAIAKKILQQKQHNKYVNFLPMDEAKKKCGEGEYYCNDDKKCKPIPKGYRIGYGGYLKPENKEDESNGKKGGSNGNGNGHGGNGNGHGGNGNGGNGGGNGGGE